jgi:hypothetical protein
LVTEITVIFSQNIQLAQETRPMQFSVIQQIAENNKDLPIRPLSNKILRVLLLPLVPVLLIIVYFDLNEAI